MPKINLSHSSTSGNNKGLQVEDRFSEQTWRQILRAIMPLSQNVEMIESNDFTITFSLLLSKVYHDLSFNIRIIIDQRDLTIKM